MRLWVSYVIIFVIVRLARRYGRSTGEALWSTALLLLQQVLGKLAGRIVLRCGIATAGGRAATAAGAILGSGGVRRSAGGGCYHVRRVRSGAVGRDRLVLGVDDKAGGIGAGAAIDGAAQQDLLAVIGDDRLESFPLQVKRKKGCGLLVVFYNQNPRHVVSTPGRMIWNVLPWPGSRYPGCRSRRR